MYTTHGLMTPADMQDYRELYDLLPERCPECDGQLASDGVCADDTCGDDDLEPL